ncbi:MAG: radical SAM protein [Candidatus Omnitrophica bacterium]|nr:radical SAM protein [Candidatus Omnitrophota bacterium]
MIKDIKITFGWDLCYSCNYRCPYCNGWLRESKDDIIMTAGEWEKIWNNIYERYGSCYIYLSGGEPSTYPYFYELVKRLTQKHIIDICTNLSWDVEKLIPFISSQNLKISATFHPLFADFDVFFKKIVMIREYLSNYQVFFVVYNKQIDILKKAKEFLKEFDIRLIPQPLRGPNQSIINSEEEKEIVKDQTPYTGDKLAYQLKEKIPKGKLCRAGQYYAVIRANGRVDRCSQYTDGQLGNFLEKDFKLFSEPKVCTLDYCPIESQWIIE